MKPNKTLVLALSGLMLAVIASGTAFANTWPGSDSSKLVNSAYGSWESYITQTSEPTVPGGSTLTWDNSFKNLYGGTYYPTLVTYDQNMQNEQDTAINAALTYGQRYPTSASEYFTGSRAAASSSGWHCMYVSHYYGATIGDTAIPTTGPQFVEQSYNVR
ncbi:hypothetical protein Mtc_1134 [Methanocella conradii HZ254]|uniref:Uncharacterized protein n=1 Tax=Methanocella conradii (strain DSM 24694 / JCM 17849 / CGMCC 1.5162 / HZ254) TaxID=1041930 RepID=H8I7Q5_METCZ|nr:hypothetical protein [Methanocella conradii]AFC99890.1 hypothetical protein Mtc_1134 [Methanocella conradii HZ254]